MIYRGTEAGMMDLALHPNYAQNHLVYFSYHKPIGDNLASNAIGRGAWDGKQLIDVKEIFLSDDVDTEVSRIAFGRDGMLYMTIGSPGTGQPEAVARAQHKNDYAGKLLRMRDDGSVPPDNPFVGNKDYKPYIFAMGFRNQLGLTMNPFNGDICAGEQGPNGGDEVNVIEGREELRLAARELRPRLQRAALSRVARREGVRRAGRVLGAVDCPVGDDVLQRRPVSQLAPQPVRRRHARRRNVADRAAGSRRLQRQMGRTATRVAAARSASADPRRPTGPRRQPLCPDRGERFRDPEDRAGRRPAADQVGSDVFTLLRSRCWVRVHVQVRLTYRR